MPSSCSPGSAAAGGRGCAGHDSVDEIIADSVRGEPDLGAVRPSTTRESRLTMLLWNYHDVAGGYEDRREVQLTIDGLPGAAPEHGPSNTRSTNNPATRIPRGWRWVAANAPAEQIAKLHAAAKMRPVPRDIDTAAEGSAVAAGHAAPIGEADRDRSGDGRE